MSLTRGGERILHEISINVQPVNTIDISTAQMLERIGFVLFVAGKRGSSYQRWVPTDKGEEYLEKMSFGRTQRSVVRRERARVLTSSGYKYGREAEEILARQGQPICPWCGGLVNTPKLRTPEVRCQHDFHARPVRRTAAAMLGVAEAELYGPLDIEKLKQSQTQQNESENSMSCDTQKELYEYVVILRMSDEDGADASEVIVEPATVMAANEDTVKMIATKAIPEQYDADLAFCEVVVRPFRR